jgi:membrane-bound lytic murein transglycosylase D
MRSLLLWTLLCTSCLGVIGEEQVITMDEVVDTGVQWARENLDESLVQAIDQVDLQKVQRYLQDLDRTMDSDYILDLAPLKNSAHSILPLLEQHDQTQPYAAWLKAHLDYFDVADQLRIILVPRPTQPESKLTNRTVLDLPTQRNLWFKQLEKRPRPTQADSFAQRFKPVFAAQQVPESLVWLAEVESGFEPSARSPSEAVGLYQLTSTTAKSLGLSLVPQDDRLDPDKNAAAAARYLRYLNGRFPEWPLTLAAYNAGEGRLQNLINRHKTRDFDRLSRYLPAETQLYVPKIEATLRRREKVELQSLRPVPADKSVTKSLPAVSK